MAEAQKEAAKKQQAEAAAQTKAATEERAKSNAETMERQNKSKPTPTQEENDLAAAGQSVDEKEYDGSPPQGVSPEDAAAAAKSYKQPEGSAFVGSKQVEADKPGKYQTRQAQPRA